jgi:hypothetical protein
LNSKTKELKEQKHQDPDLYFDDPTEFVKPLSDMFDSAPIDSEVTITTSYGDLSYTKVGPDEWMHSDGQGINTHSFGLAMALVGQDSVKLSKFYPGSTSTPTTSSSGSGYTSNENSPAFQKVKSDIDEFIKKAKNIKLVSPNSLT